MSSWAARAKLHLSHKGQTGTDETDEIGVLSVLSVPSGALCEKQQAANDPLPACPTATPDPDRYAWPNSPAMTGAEIDAFTSRLTGFTTQGATPAQAEQLADQLVQRDREADDRRLCLECQHLSGHTPGGWRCRNWQRAGVAMDARGAGLPGDLVRTLQRCAGFQAPQGTAP
jgi:hypothetical protein